MPTVYFSWETFDGIEFARITQTYPDPKNVGRGAVRTSRDYKIYNVQVEKKVLGLFTKTVTQGLEYYDGHVQHMSRNEFISKDEFAEHDLALCAQSIKKFTEIKPKY
ncbi:MAG: hypothetical protein AAF899_18795 [Pseudomonadota bacterium]